MKNSTEGLSVVVLLAVLSACAHAPKRLDNIPLLWKPTTEIKLPAGTLDKLIDTKFQFDVFKDVRQHPDLIAENREEATPRSVTTRDNVGEFVATHARGAFDRIGLKTVDKDGDVVVAGDLRQFFVDETDTYKGRVQLRVSVRNHNGKSLWTGPVTGVAKNFGRSYSAENYYETLSNAILDAVSSLVEDADFRAALIRKE